MRRRLVAIEHWAVQHSPILPFLAPAVFAHCTASAVHSRSLQNQPRARLDDQPPFCLRNPAIETNCSTTDAYRRKRHDAICISRSRCTLPALVAPALPTPKGLRAFHSFQPLGKVINSQSGGHVSGVDTQSSTAAPEQPGNVEGLKRFPIPLKADYGANASKFFRSNNLGTLNVDTTLFEPEDLNEISNSDLNVEHSEGSQNAHMPFEGRQTYDDYASMSDDESTWQAAIRRLIEKSRGEERINERRADGSWAANVLASLPSLDAGIDDFRATYRARNISFRLRWSAMIMHLLDTDVRSSIKFLMATLNEPLPPNSQVADVFSFLVRCITYRPDDFKPEDISMMGAAMDLALEQYQSPAILTPRSIQFYVRQWPDRRVSFCRALIDRGTIFTERTALHFALALADVARFDTAIEVLQRAVEAGTEVNGLPFLKTCRLLLRKSRGDGGKYEHSTAILAQLFQMGVGIHVTQYNILLVNAAEVGDAGTAWLIYKEMCENGPQPDDHTFVILLNMCRKLNDRDGYRFINYEAHPTRRELHPHLVTEILVCRNHFNRNSNFDHVLRFYERHCDLLSLKQLEIIQPEHQSRWIGTNEEISSPRLPPVAGSLGFMMLTYLRHTTGVKIAREMYRKFQQLLEAGDRCATHLAATTHTYNLFIKIFARSKDTFKLWPSILRDMIRPFNITMHDPLTGRLLHPAKPDTQTWNIILHGLSRDGQRESAAKIAELMLKNNMKPDIVTWNSLISGLSRGPSLSALGEVLRRFEASGLKPDSWTTKALHPLQYSKLRLERLMEIRESVEGLAEATAYDKIQRLRSLRKARNTTIRRKVARKFERKRLHDEPLKLRSMTSSFANCYGPGSGTLIIRPLRPKVPINFRLVLHKGLGSPIKVFAPCRSLLRFKRLRTLALQQPTKQAGLKLWFLRKTSSRTKRRRFRVATDQLKPAPANARRTLKARRRRSAKGGRAGAGVEE